MTPNPEASNLPNGQVDADAEELALVAEVDRRDAVRRAEALARRLDAEAQADRKRADDEAAPRYLKGVPHREIRGTWLVSYCRCGEPLGATLVASAVKGKASPPLPQVCRHKGRKP